MLENDRPFTMLTSRYSITIMGIFLEINTFLELGVPVSPGFPSLAYEHSIW